MELDWNRIDFRQLLPSNNCYTGIRHWKEHSDEHYEQQSIRRVSIEEGQDRVDAEQKTVL
jgi:hypothetical protein